jgi:hypothetical protein
MKFVHSSELSKRIRNVLGGRRSDMAVAFWGNGACKRLAITREAIGSRVACDARSGGCNPSAISDLLDCKVAIVDVPGLHAKVYIGEQGVVITSANASVNGLGEEDDEVSEILEAGYLTKRPGDVEIARQWFETVFKRGVPVTKADLPELRALWLERRRHRPVRGKQTFLDVLLNKPKLLRDRRLRVAIGPDQKLPAAVEKEYKHTQFYSPAKYERMPPYTFFWNASVWKARTGDLILNLIGDKHAKRIECDGVWRVQDVTKSGLIPVEQVQKPLGLPLPPSDKLKLAKQVQALVDRGDLKANWSLISIEEFARALAM